MYKPMRPTRAGFSRLRNRQQAAARSFGDRAGGQVAALLAILFWYFFIQNLPAKVGDLPFKFVDTSGSIDRFVKLLMIGACTVLIATKWSVFRQVARTTNPALLGFFLLAPLSTLWSIDPSATFLRSTTLASIILLCFALSLTGWNRLRFQQLVTGPMMFILVCSLLYGLVSRDAVMEIGDSISLKDAWRGVTHSKNQFGMIACAATVVCFNRWLANEGRRGWALAGTLVGVVCLALSRSNTSMFATFVGMVFLFTVMRVPIIRQRFSGHVLIAIVATVIVYQMAIHRMIPGAHMLLEPIVALTGKDMTFSARTIIWEIVGENVAAHPYLGSGYGGYWTGWEDLDSPSQVFMWVMYFYPTSSHNGYLEIRNDFGYPGLLLLVVFIGWFVWQSIQLMRHDRAQGALYAALLCQQMVINMSESDWFARTNSFAVMLLASTFMARAISEYRAAAAQRVPTASKPQGGSPTGESARPGRHAGLRELRDLGNRQGTGWSR